MDLSDEWLQGIAAQFPHLLCLSLKTRTLCIEENNNLRFINKEQLNPS